MDVDGYECNLVFGADKHSILARTCLKRPSDGYFSIAYVERIPFQGDEEKALEDIVTPIAKLKFTTEDAMIWDWHPTLQEAVDASHSIFAPFEKWTAHAPNK